MPYDGYGGDEGFPHDGKQGRCIYYLNKKLRRKVQQEVNNGKEDNA